MRKAFLCILCLSWTLLIPGSASAQEKKIGPAPKDAITAKDFCNDTAGTRTTRVFINNQTNWMIVIAFAQLKDESNNIPSGYTSDTGTFVLGTNDTGPSTIQLDPCYVGGSQRPIQATRGSGSVKLTNGSQEVDLNLPDVTDGDVTTYYGTVGWDVGYSVALKKPIISGAKLKKQ
jgi:hypothetical protein